MILPNMISSSNVKGPNTPGSLLGTETLVIPSVMSSARDYPPQLADSDVVRVKDMLYLLIR